MAVYKCEKSLYNLNDKDLYFVQVGNLKQALNYGLTLKKVYRVIKFFQLSWFILEICHCL